MSTGAVQIAWARVDGRFCHISEFAGLALGERPLAACEACDRRLVMKLGRTRAYHFAHEATSVCVLTAPETAIHYNTKRFLADRLAMARRLYVARRCVGTCTQPACSETIATTIVEDWDEVCVEVSLDHVRPDVVLRRGGTAILAIEVRATHAVSDAKEARLKNIDVPWIEVDAGFE